MSTFPKTRAAAGYIARHARGGLTRGRAAVLTARPDACEGIPAGGDVPAVFHGLLRDLALAARDLAGPAWLAAASDDPDIAAFTALQAIPVPPSPAELDEIISRVLWARFAPPATAAAPAPEPGTVQRPAAMCRPVRTAADPRPGRHPGRGSAAGTRPAPAPQPGTAQQLAAAVTR